MLKTWLAAGALGLMIAMSSAQAMPIGDASGDAHVILAYGGCGPCGHRGPYGGCQPGKPVGPPRGRSGLPPWAVSACVLADRLMHESRQG